jgi:hypothetical protein
MFQRVRPCYFEPFNWFEALTTPDGTLFPREIAQTIFASARRMLQAKVAPPHHEFEISHLSFS